MTREFDPAAEFDRQVRNLLDRGYPALTGLPEPEFLALVEPLRDVAVARGGSLGGATPERAPFALVIDAAADQAMRLTDLAGRPGFADFDPDDLARFAPIKELPIPEGPAYLVFGLERGEEYLNVTPDKAMVDITARERTPLTVAEGIAFITQFPGSLQKNHCFSLAGSRCGDRRVPALWISKRAPKLGWCWAGNPHTWLGAASCADRASAA